VTTAGLIYCLVTGVALLLFVVIFVISLRKRPASVPAPREPLGFVTEITHDENGLYAKGVLTQAGVEATSRGEMQHISLGFTQDGKLRDASAVLDPRPCKGANSNICVAEGCFGEACIKKWMTKHP
jgi:hypothetical protein